MGELEIFAIRIRQLRESLKMTQTEFSNHIGIKQQTLSGYERGIMKPPLDVAKFIAEKCNVSIDWLCGLSENKHLHNQPETYSDVIQLLDILERNRDLGLEIMKLDVPCFPYTETPVITFDNSVMISYLYRWFDMYVVKENAVIKQELYDLWIREEMRSEDCNKKISQEHVMCFEASSCEKSNN